MAALARVSGDEIVLLSSDRLAGEESEHREVGNAREQARDETDWLCNRRVTRFSLASFPFLI